MIASTKVNHEGRCGAREIHDSRDGGSAGLVNPAPRPNHLIHLGRPRWCESPHCDQEPTHEVRYRLEHGAERTTLRCADCRVELVEELSKGQATSIVCERVRR